MAGIENEHPDHYMCQGVMFPSDGINFYLQALEFYRTLLEADLSALQEETDLMAVMDLERPEALEVVQELEKIKRLIDWLSPEGEARKHGFGTWPIQVSHGFLRYLKSTGLLYMKKLRNSRERVARRPNVSKHTVEAVDRRLAKLEENFTSGVFAKVSPIPLLLDDFVGEVPTARTEQVAAVRLSDAAPRPRLIESIEILDSQLRGRCMDLFVKFQEDGQTERLDTVVTEATRILEDRLRSRSGAPKDKFGMDLATYALSPKAPKLVVSELDAEQEAAHLLCRGVFGFVRNHVHHQLVGDYSPERALQIVGMIDYLLSVVEAAQFGEQKEQNGQK